MSPPNEPKHDELRDRLMDQALGEVLGREAPPDLSDKILAAAQRESFTSRQRKERVMNGSKRRYWVWGLCAVAACLLVGIGFAMMNPDVRQLALGPPEADEPAEAEREFAKTAALPQMAARMGAENAEKTAESEASQKSPAVDPFYLHKSTQLANIRAPSAEPSAPPPPGQVFGRPLSEKPKSVGDSIRAEEYWGTTPEGEGPGKGGDQYGHLPENPFCTVKDHPLSTFSIDVDTASYANVRRFLLSEGRLPPPDAVRIEELVNYFDYGYEGPEDDVPFASHIEITGCPWKPQHRLVRVGLKGREIQAEQRPASNLVFLLDVSGSMNSPDKLPLLKAGMKLLAEQLDEDDRVAIVVYAQAEGLVLPSTPGSEHADIIAALENLQAGGSTNGGAGIELAYKIAQENFIEGGVNRVLLCTDGDFNVGTTSQGDLVRMVEEKARSGVFLSVLGFGRGNLNDAMMETVSNKGNGNYSYIDGVTEARKVLVEQMGGTLVTIAKDVKIQIEFNPARVAAYRLIGYENRILAAEDFNDDKKDAGEIGAGHTVTALYEVVPVGEPVDTPSVDPLKYQAPVEPSGDPSIRDEMLTLKLRYKEPDADESRLLEFPVVDAGTDFTRASTDLQFAASVASFGMMLRNSQHSGDATFDAVLEIAASATGPDVHGYRAEFLDMVRRAKALASQ